MRVPARDRVATGTADDVLDQQSLGRRKEGLRPRGGGASGGIRRNGNHPVPGTYLACIARNEDRLDTERETSAQNPEGALNGRPLVHAYVLNWLEGEMGRYDRNAEPSQEFLCRSWNASVFYVISGSVGRTHWVGRREEPQRSHECRRTREEALAGGEHQPFP